MVGGVMSPMGGLSSHPNGVGEITANILAVVVGGLG
jgi:hypothetical protein